MQIDWYERRSELRAWQVFSTAEGVVRLDRRVPGDGTQWYVDQWFGKWESWDHIIEPGDLIDRLPDDYSGTNAA